MEIHQTYKIIRMYEGRKPSTSLTQQMLMGLHHKYLWVLRVHVQGN